MTTDYQVPRPASEQLVDLHVYLLPREEWSEKYSSTYIESIDKALSAGFVRVWPDLTVSGLRMLIENELGHDVLPQSYVFLRSVGSRMTQVKSKQELELKCKAFLPPTAWAPEIVVLEVPRDSMSVPVYQSFPGYSPRHDATRPINGIPTHFPQVANHDRMAQQDGLDARSKLALEAIKEKAQDKTKKAKSKDPNLAKDCKASRLAKKGEAKQVVSNKKTAGNKAIQSKAGLERTKRLKKTQAAWSKEAKRPKLSQAQEKETSSVGSVRDRNSRARKEETGLEKERNEGIGRGQIKALKKTDSGRRKGGKIGQESLGTIPRPQGKVIEVLPANIKADRLGKIQQDRTVQTSGIYIGQSPMMQQQQGYKSDPLQSMMGNPGKSGRPDAYTNNTNEDSGIAEPTPDDEDPDYERRKSEIDDQCYNQLHPNQTQNEQFQHEYEEKELEEERQRQAEIQEREEERRREEERIVAEEQREEERREHERKLERKQKEDAKKQRQREMEQKWEDERRKEEEKMREEQERKEEAERDRASAFDGAMPLDDGDEDYDDAAIAMETNQAQDGRGHFLNDEQMKRRAEDELRDYEPQSTWKRDGQRGGGEMSHLAQHGRRSRSREDNEMEIASQQAVQDGLKRVHLTPEVHRKAKIGKIRNSSITDEEDIYETDPEMAELMEQRQLARQERMRKEKERESLIKKARDLQTKTYERRNRSRDYWKKRYYDEKKKTAPFEEQISRMRNQLELMHRKLLNHLEGKKKGVKVKGPPSKKNDHKINILKMQHEMDELKRKVDNSRMKLTSEIKLRNQAETEVRGLKSEVTQRKINMTLIRNQKLAALKTGDKNLLSKTPIPALGQGHMSFSAKR